MKRGFTIVAGLVLVLVLVFVAYPMVRSRMGEDDAAAADAGAPKDAPWYLAVFGGAGAGAAAGTAIFPVVGTIIGAVVGAVAGGLGSKRNASDTNFGAAKDRNGNGKVSGWDELRWLFTSKKKRAELIASAGGG